MDKCCGTCAYHRYDELTDDWVRSNDMSENYADYTDYNDSCIDWEEREQY